MAKDKMLKATHSSEGHHLKIGDTEIPCYVLESGLRVVVQRGLTKSLGMSTGGGIGGAQRIAEFLSTKTMKPFVNRDLLLRIKKPIKFLTKTGVVAYGFEATIIVDICNSVLQARKQEALTKRQIHIAESCEILVRSFAKVGIIALVDEATGYQYDRERQELQKILKAYIAEELLPWQKRFPDIFYQEIFRLKGWAYTVENIKNKPPIIGTWTNKLIYEQLPAGVLKELKNKTPKSPAGNYTAKFHQSLTLDIGNPHLQKQLVTVITLMNLSDNWKQLISNFNKVVDRKNGQLELKFEDLDYKDEPELIISETGEVIENPNSFNKVLNAVLKVPPPKKNKK